LEIVIPKGDSRMAKVRITVVKKLNHKSLYGDNPPATFTASPECDILEVGQEFIVEDPRKCPPGFCGWAFADIHRDITLFSYGCSYTENIPEGTSLACCTDGYRPVIFKLERIDD